MSDFIHDSGSSASSPPTTTTTFTYPWASAPDIIRANQKDAYFQSHLLSQLSSVIRSLYGARTAHTYSAEARTFTELLYLTLTTFVGNRTLGEEYCDIVQFEDREHRLPSAIRRGGYILASVLTPYLLARLLPRLRRNLRSRLESALRKKTSQRRASSSQNSKSPTPNAYPRSKTTKLQQYVLENLDTLTSPSPLHALSLATFYFTGAYYQLSKRLFSLRYTFTRQLEETEQRVGYEVLGVLLCLQMGVQGYLHFASTWQSVRNSTLPSSAAEMGGTSAVIDGGVEVVTTGADDTIAAPLLFEPFPDSNSTDPAETADRLRRLTHTPVVPDGKPRYDLEDTEVMGFIEGTHNRKCTLCLEAMKDPAVTTCGHVFCWRCVGDWLREQAMCPLCRQGCLGQHVLPLRG